MDVGGRCSSSDKAVFSAFNRDGQPVPHSEHAQIDPLVRVQLLIEGIQDPGSDITDGGTDNVSTPKHLLKGKRKSLLTPPVHLCTSAPVGCTDVIDGDDAAFSNQPQGYLVVVVIVGFIGVDEHKVEGSGLASLYQFI